MQATSITDPWQGGESEGYSSGDGRPLESSVDLGAANTEPPGPIREYVEDVLAAIGLTVDDLRVLGTVGNAAAMLIAAATFAGWL